MPTAFSHGLPETGLIWASLSPDLLAKSGPDHAGLWHFRAALTSWQCVSTCFVVPPSSQPCNAPHSAAANLLPNSQILPHWSADIKSHRQCSLTGPLAWGPHRTGHDHVVSSWSQHLGDGHALLWAVRPGVQRRAPHKQPLTADRFRITGATTLVFSLALVKASRLRAITMRPALCRN